MRVRRPGRERGFVLVSVIMFVLVLTLLGTSLLSHGPLETSLIVDNENSVQAFYRAEQGLSRGINSMRFVNNLLDVNGARPTSLGTTVVPYIRAYQLQADGSWDSIGTLHRFGPDARTIRMRAQGRATAAANFASETRTVEMTFMPAAPAVDPRGLITATGSFHLAKDDTLIGTIRTPTPAESAVVVNYGSQPGAWPIPPESVSVSTPAALDLDSFIASKIAGGYSSITSSDISASSAASPLVLGQSGNGIYYSSGGLSVPGGAVAAMKIYGTVYILVKGQTVMSKDLDIVKGNANAALVIVDAAGTAGGSGFTFNKLANASNVPLVMVTNGDVTFKKAGTLNSASIFGRDIFLAKQQKFAYDHAVMDPFLTSLMLSGGYPMTNLTGSGLVPVLGTWTYYPY